MGRELRDAILTVLKWFEAASYRDEYPKPGELGDALDTLRRATSGRVPGDVDDPPVSL